MSAAFASRPRPMTSTARPGHEASFVKAWDMFTSCVHGEDSGCPDADGGVSRRHRKAAFVISHYICILSSSLDPLSRELEHLLERLRGLPPPHALCGHSRRWSVRRCSGAGLVCHRCSGRGGPRLGPSTSSLRLTWMRSRWATESAVQLWLTEATVRREMMTTTRVWKPSDTDGGGRGRGRGRRR